MKLKHRNGLIDNEINNCLSPLFKKYSLNVHLGYFLEFYIAFQDSGKTISWQKLVNLIRVLKHDFHSLINGSIFRDPVIKE